MRDSGFRWLVIVLLVLGIVNGCQRPGPSVRPSPPLPPTFTAPIPIEVLAASNIDPATAGTIQGTVIIEGTPPRMRPINFDPDAWCKSVHREPVLMETVVVNPEGALKNVFVYVKRGLETRTFTPPREPALVELVGCLFQPRVLGIQAGQRLDFMNCDDTLHNVHALPKRNSEFNKGLPVKGMKFYHQFTEVEIMVQFKDDIHPWMKAYVGVLDHPYFQVTGADGTFKLTPLPAGTYTIEAWHEKFGLQTKSVTLGEKETKEISFTFPGQP